MCRSPGKNTGWWTIATGVASLGRPGDAAAQSGPVFRALEDLQAALDGLYGDEGAEVARRLGDLSEAVANWDRSIREAEQRLRPRLAGSPEEAAAAHEALGSVYWSAADSLMRLPSSRRQAGWRLNGRRCIFCAGSRSTPCIRGRCQG